MQFNIWNPYALDPTHVTFDVTMRDTALVSEGTSSFVSACLESCGITSPAVSRWTVKRVRQSYYSDYAHHEDWRARWDLAWVFDVELGRTIDVDREFNPFPFTTDAIDESSTDANEPSTSQDPGLIIAGFKGASLSQGGIQKSVDDWSEQYNWKDTTTVRVQSYDSGFVHTRILVDAVRFPEELDALVALNRLLKQLGGQTEWRLTVSAQQPKEG